VNVNHGQRFREWIMVMDPRLAGFEDFVMPAEWSGDFSRESLIELERFILTSWPDKKAFLEEADPNFVDGATRYIGESFMRLAGGEWFLDEDPDFIYSGFPVFRFDSENKTAVSPFHLMTTILARRNGEVLGRMWDGNERSVTRRRQNEGPGWTPRRSPMPGLVTEPLPSSPEVERWTRRVPALIDALRRRAGRRAAELDLSVRSLGVVSELLLEDGASDAFSSGAVQDAKDPYVAYVGEVALAAAGGSWVLVDGPRDSKNPFVGRPFVERLGDSDDPREILVGAAVDRALLLGSSDELARIVESYMTDPA